MNTMKWLVKREFWEHKGGFYWAPIVVGAIMVFFLAATVFSGVVMGHSHGFNINGNNVTAMTHDMSADERSQFAHGLATGYMGLAFPLFLVLGVVVFFFCLSALFDDRKDRSVLFWKSLPISDTETVLSKVAIAMAGAPLITVVLAFVVSFVSLVIICIGSALLGINVVGPVLSDPNLYLSPFEVAGVLPVYVLWAAPTIGWLMMVSAWARTKPFLWAVGVPVFAGTLLTWFNAIFSFGWDIRWFWQHIVGRGLGGTIPGIWFAYHPVPATALETANGMNANSHTGDMGAILMQSWHVLAEPDMWIGIAAGAAMIYAAIRLRRWRDEG